MAGKKVAVGLSGGVDSAVSAALLKEQGFEVIGVTMANWDKSLHFNVPIPDSCYGPCEGESLEAVEKIAKVLDIPYKIFDLSEAYRDNIISYFKREYMCGRTPNPCVRCNFKMKFGLLFEKARAELGTELFATGHYARIIEENGRLYLAKALNTAKDQSYFLQMLKRDWLPHIIFPLGEMTKEEVRATAKKFALPVADKEESQDFMGGQHAVLFEDEPIKEGNIVDENGKILGRHKGIIHYTIGQRKGLGISNPKPLFVLKIDAEKNEVVVTEKEHLFSTGLLASELNLLCEVENPNGFKALAKIRQKHKECPSTVTLLENGRFKVVFEDPQLSVTPGQAVALYREDGILIGGGIIEEGI